MKKIWTVLAVVATLAACSKTDAQKLDSSSPAATQPAETTAAEKPAGEAKAETARAAATAAAPVAETATEAAAQTREWRDVTIPAGTILKVNLNSSVGSDTSSVEDQVRGTLRSPITIKGTTALPAGTALTGHVTDAARSAKVKGRARIALRFTRLDPPGPDSSMAIRTATISRVAPGTKKQDAAKIGAGAVGGAIVGGIVGGGDGAAKGAAIGGGAGTGVVLATRGKEVRLGPGTPLSVRLTQAITVRVPLR